MKPIAVIIIAFAFSLSACTKTTNLVAPSPVEYSVDGVHDITLYMGYYSSSPTVSLPVTLTYHDSVQEAVTVTITGVPPTVSYGITNSGGLITSAGPWTGIPTFTLPLIFTPLNQYAPYTAGVYPITVTCTSAAGVSKIYTFNLTLI